MADTVQYGMGQIRYSGNNGDYINSISSSYTPINVKVNALDETSSSIYQDILLTPTENNFSFEPGTPYLLHLEIPQDINYNNTFRIKMVSGVKAGDTLDSNTVGYQTLKYINVEQNTKGSNTVRAISFPITESVYIKTQDTSFIQGKTYYENIEGGYQETQDSTYDSEKIYYEYRSKMPWDGGNGSFSLLQKTFAVEDIEKVDLYDVYYNNGQYYYITYIPEDGAIEQIEQTVIHNKTDAILNLWTQEKQTNKIPFDIVFTPKTTEDTYNAIWIELLRQDIDSDMYEITDDGHTLYGRRIDEQYFDASLYQITNLVTDLNIDSNKGLSHIGIYGHPNLIMAINGEEIRIGQTGYYELNDFKITSFGVAARSDKDRFTLDYQYIIPTDE